MNAAWALTGMAVVSALGRGRAEHVAALRRRAGGLRPNDFDAAVGGWIGRVAGVEDHCLPAAERRFDCRNNRLADMALETDDFLAAVATARVRYGATRVGVVVGTSTSGVLAAEEAYREGAPDAPLPEAFDFEGTQDIGSLGRFVARRLGLLGPTYVVSIACASSARCFADGAGLIEAGLCDAVVVGGADSLCRMTLHGFAALELIAPGPTRPCDAERNGISLGEAAGFVLLERATPEVAGVRLLGWGASSDAHHMSHPHPEGAGAVRAMRGALEAAGLSADEIDWVSLHGTGTRANDAMEDRAVHAVFGGAVAASSVKGWTGHTLGACGVVAAVLAAECIRFGLVPGCLGMSRLDPEFRANMVVANADRPVRRVLTNAFGFGGVNCSLVFGRQ